uniref:Uncharacterized protein n=1 Tax=Oryza brachyantha TaxID=4533 RepID=J3KVA8_ORYBR
MTKVILIPGKELLGCRCTFGESFPNQDSREIVVFEPFFGRGIQPLKDIDHYAFEYLGGDDPIQESNEVLQKDVITSRTSRLFQQGTFIPSQPSHFPTPYHSGNTPLAYLSYTPSRQILELKWVAETSADELVAKRVALDPDAEPSEAVEDADAPSPQQSPSPSPLKRLRRPAFRQGSRKASNIDPSGPAGCVPPADYGALASQTVPTTLAILPDSAIPQEPSADAAPTSLTPPSLLTRTKRLP